MSRKYRVTPGSFARVIINERGQVLVSDTLSYLASEETIVSDDTRYQGSSNCVHDSTFVSVGSNTHKWYGGSSGTTYWSASTPTAFGVGSLFGTQTFSPVDLNSLHIEAFRTMKPGMESGFSATNFLLELGEMKSLFRVWNKAQSFIKNVSGGFLNYNYGWKQTIRDIQDITSRLSSFSVRLARLINEQGKPIKRHFSKVLESARSTTEQPFTTWGNDAVRYVYTYNVPLTYTATMYYRYKLPEVSSSVLRARALADHFGVNFNLSQFWNAIPLSFVVDWFVSVGKFLTQFDSNWIEPTIEILDFCYSLKHDISTDIYCRRNVANAANGFVYSHSSRRKIYHRYRTLPNLHAISNLETSGGWDLTRYLLAGSLVHQRL